MMDYDLEPYYEDEGFRQQTVQDGYGTFGGGMSDDGEYTDDFVNSSPSPRERIGSTSDPRYQPRYETYNVPHDVYDRNQYRAPVYQPQTRDFRAQFNQSAQNIQTARPAHASSRIPSHFQDYEHQLPSSQIQPRERASGPSVSRNPAPAPARPRHPEQVIQSQGYQPRTSQRLTLRPVSDLPDMYRGIFKFGLFNAVQSSCFDSASDVFRSKKSMVISAPTGSGKTVIFELSIIKMLLEAQETGQTVKCIYVAPTKALCSERYRDWANKFDPLGAKCCELTGDTVHFGKGAWGDAKNANIIITTGEKWDSLTRNWGDHGQTLSQIQLFLVDEVHILNETRGSTLEVIVSRMKLRGSAVRFVFVSATVPNIHDIANWIGSGGPDGPAEVFEFGEEFRPCKLTRHVVGFHRAKGQNDFVFSKNLDYKLFSVLQTHSVGKPMLVFVSTRKGVFTCADQLAKDYNEAASKRQTLPWTRPGRVDRIFNDKRLSELASLGIGVHHAGLSTDDRRTIEDMFLSKILRVVIATTTLAVGVNLPAHTVVLKGVHTFQGSASVEYTDLDIMQMLGRAGRPQFDKDGIAIIMCETELETKYRALVQGKTIVESSLHTNLPEHLNSEIGLGTISNIDSAKEWLKSSFLFQRIQKNPRHYSLGKDEEQTWEDRVDGIVMQSLENLQSSELIVKDEDSDTISSTEYGDIMSKFYIRQRTMALILDIPERCAMRQVASIEDKMHFFSVCSRLFQLDMIASAEEFSESRLRASDKTIYNKLRRHNDIRYEVKKVEKTADKVLLLIQAVLGGISLNSPEYKTSDSQPQLEALGVFRHLHRIARAIVEVAIARKFGPQLKYGLELVRCFSAKAWEDRPVVLRQIDTIGEKSLKVLAENGITSLATLRKQDSLRLERLLNRRPPFGLEMLAAAKEFPVYTLRVDEVAVHSNGGRSPVEVELLVECHLAEEAGTTKSKKLTKGRQSNWTAVLTLTSDLQFVDFRRILTKALKETKTFEITVTLEKPSQTAVIYVSSETYAGTTVMKSYKPTIAASEYPTMNTKPATAIELELQGLEDCPDLFEMGVDEHGDEIADEEQPEPIKFKDLTKSSGNKKLKDTDDKEPCQASSVQAPAPPPKKLPNGLYQCNHSCKDKQKCRHLCCREGLPDPPKSKAGAATAQSNTTASQNSVSSKRPAAKASPALKPKKPRVKPDQTLDDLEKWHKSTDVRKSLKLPQGHRIKLEPSPDIGTSKRKKGPPPNFDIEFAIIESAETQERELPDTLDDDDDDLPQPHEILGPSNKKRTFSSDDNYSNSELDALIRDVDYDGSLALNGSVDVGEARVAGPAKKRAKLDEELIGAPKGRDRTKKKPTSALPESLSIFRSKPQTLFIPDSDDDLEISPIHDLKETTTEKDDEQPYDDFALDPQYYSTTPATPDLTMSALSEEDDEMNSSLNFSLRGRDFPAPEGSSFPGQKSLATSMSKKMEPAQSMHVSVSVIEEPKDPGMAMDQGELEEDDEFAALEAWLDQNTVQV